MRELKYRQWIGGEFHYWGIGVSASSFDGPASGSGRSGERIDNTHHMQFTGLKDRNGAEIYEGDIVKWDDESNGRYWRVAKVVLFPSLAFKCFDCPAIENSSAHGHTFHYGNFIYKDTENHLEVIGNIYENTELLTPSETGREGG